MSTSALWRRIHGGSIATLAVMGMSKNTGKTVALNHLLAQAAAAQWQVGVTSIGRDGEERDQVFLVPKPPVQVWPGTLVATARATLQRARLRVQFVAGTDIASPMGEIVVVRALEFGDMEIAGASRGSDQLAVIGRLRQCGATLVLLDGALGRSQHASPAIADAVVLATGAALGGGIADVLRKTRDRLAILGIPQADAATLQRCEAVFADGGVGIWDSDAKPLFLERIATLNADATLAQYIDSAPATVALSGAVGRRVWRSLDAMARRNPGLSVVVADGTRLFVENHELAAFQLLGATLCAWRAIHVIGVTLNPFSPMGGSFGAQELLTSARKELAGHEVSDVLLEQGAQALTGPTGITEPKEI